MIKNNGRILVKKKLEQQIYICFFIGSLDLGGTEKQLVNLINSLDKKKFKIDLYLLTDKKGDLFGELNSSVKVFLPKFKFKSKLRYFFNFLVTYFRIRRTKPKIIHTFLPYAYLVGGLIGYFLNHPNIIMSRRSMNNYQKKFKFLPIRKIEMFLHKKIKLIITNAKAVRQNIISEGAPKNKVKVIYNGFIKNNTNFKASPYGFKQNLGIEKKSFVFLVLANLIPYKNHKLVIDAVNSLSKVVKKKFKVIFLGSGKKEYRSYLKRLIKERQIESYFLFKNKTKNIHNFLNITNVGISSSKEEGLSNSLIEFISFGIPTIATKVGGNSEITTSKNGFLIENNNTKQLIAAMKTSMNDKKLLKIKSIKSKKDSQKFDFDEMVKKHTKLYENISKN